VIVGSAGTAARAKAEKATVERTKRGCRPGMIIVIFQALYSRGRVNGVPRRAAEFVKYMCRALELHCTASCQSLPPSHLTHIAALFRIARVPADALCQRRLRYSPSLMGHIPVSGNRNGPTHEWHSAHTSCTSALQLDFLLRIMGMGLPSKAISGSLNPARTRGQL
jgi:hypothetical protein